MRTRMPRPRRRTTLPLEPLEGKALLAVAGNSLVLPPALVAQTNARVQAAALATARPLGPATGQQVADNGTTAITHERFKVHGGSTSYDLNLREGGDKFDQSYNLKVRRVRGQVTTGTMTAADAVVRFFQNFDALATDAIQNGGNGNGGGTGQNGDSGDIEIRRQRFRQHGGKTTYALTFRSGGYEFQQSYTLKVRRDGHQPVTGTLSAADAVGLFLQRFDAQATQYVATHGNNGALGTGASGSGQA